MTRQRHREAQRAKQAAAKKTAAAAPLEQVVRQTMTGKPGGSKRHRPEVQRAAAAELIRRIATAPKKNPAKKGTAK